MHAMTSRLSRKSSLALLAIAGAAAMFASGALAARATMDGTPAASPPAQTGTNLPFVGRDGSGAATGNQSQPAADKGGVPATGGGSTGSGGTTSPSVPVPNGCPAPLGDVVSGGTIDLSRSGFALRLLASGFSLTSISARAQGPCDANGNATSAAITVDSNWVHTETGLDAWMNQSQSSEPTPNVRQPASATFADAGYVFNINVNGYRIVPAAGDAAVDGSVKPASAPVPSPISPENDPRAAAVLDAAIAQVAPSLRLQCFYQLVAGSWADLAALGIGDPRPAIPAGFSETSIEVQRYQPPAAGCGGATLDAPGTFSASFTNGKDFNNGGGFLYVAAYPLMKDQPTNPGSINGYGANWSNATWQFGIGFKSESTLGAATIVAIAKALDPGFSEACLAQTRDLNESGLAALGLFAARPPAGFSLSSSVLQATGMGSDCKNPDPTFVGSIDLSWTFSNGADTIEARANRPGGGPKMAEAVGGGSIGPNMLNWVDAKGTFFSVYGYSKDASSNVSQDALIAVAKSMDPTLDVTKLQEQPSGGTSGSGRAVPPSPPEAKP